MATSKTYEGTTFSIPATGETNWGGNTGVDGFLIKLADNVIQKSGGTFTLSADLSFGSTAHVKGIFKTTGSNPAQTGVLRLANDETIAWRNAANDGNVTVKVNSANQLQLSGPLATSYVITLTADPAETGVVRLSNNEGIGWRNAGDSADIVLKVNASDILVFDGVVAVGDGADGAPSITLVSATTLGFYKENSNGIGVSGNLYFNDGADGSPSITFKDGGTLGLYRVNAAGIGVSGNLGLDTGGTEALPALSFSGDENTGIWRPGSDQLAISVGAGERLRIDDAANVVMRSGTTSTSRVNTFFWMPTCAGTPTGTPDKTYTNSIPTVIDTTNNKLYAYIGSAWVDLTGS